MITHIKYTVLILIYLTILFCDDYKAQESLPDLVAKVSPSVVTIEVYGSRSPKYGHIYNSHPVLLKTGTGFFISSKGEIITNYHVVKADLEIGEVPTEIKVKINNGKEYKVSGVVAFNRDSDLIQFATEVPIASVKYLSLADVLPRVGERVVVIGSPLGLEQTVSDGIISAVRKINNNSKRLQITAPISHGSSGSPVLNQQGKVVGVANSGIIEGQNLNFAIPLDEIKRLSMFSPIPYLQWKVDETLHELYDRYGTHYMEATKLIISEDYEKAFTEYKLALQDNKSNLDISRDIYEHMAFDYLEIKQFEKAIQTFNSAIRLNPTVDNYSGLADTYNSMAREIGLQQYQGKNLTDKASKQKLEDLRSLEQTYRERAKAVYLQALEEYPLESELYTRIGQIYMDLEQYDKAFQVLQIAKRQDPDNMIAKKFYGQVCLRFDYIDNAIMEYEQLKALDGLVRNSAADVKKLAHSLLLDMGVEIARREYNQNAFGEPLPKGTKKLVAFVENHTE